MERMQAIAHVRLQTPVFPKDFEFDGNNRTKIIVNKLSFFSLNTTKNFFF